MSIFSTCCNVFESLAETSKSACMYEVGSITDYWNVIDPSFIDLNVCSHDPSTYLLDIKTLPTYNKSAADNFENINFSLIYGKSLEMKHQFIE